MPTEFRIPIDNVPMEALRYGPEVGDVYKKDGGPAGFMLVISCTASLAQYIAFDTTGKITGVGQGTMSYFARRSLVGRAEEFPALNIDWI